MKTEEINVAIAESCGWKFEPSCDVSGKAVPESWVKPDGERVWDENPIPNYCGSLDAMHAAETSLTREQQFEYHNHIWDLSECDENHGNCVLDGDDVMTPSGFTMLHATAQHRAEAFLRTLGRWKD